MATLVLQAAGAIAGGLIGGPFGAILGRAVGAVAGAAVDTAIMGGKSGGDRVGPRVTALAGVASNEGAAMARVYGRARVGGQMIWATRFEESVSVQRSGGSGGKGGGGGATTTTYSYFANFAIALCEGPIRDVRRIWADGKEIDQTQFVIRVYPGDETQNADALIVAKEGDAPAYRGTAYVVFERMALADFGNRVPQLTFEVIKPVHGLGEMVRAIDIIPGASEFAYSPAPRMQGRAFGASSSENRHQLVRASDWNASLDALQALCPNLEHVGLVVAWFGDDLRAGHCTVAPRVENDTKFVIEESWSVAGLARADARVVSEVDGKPAYGGTPSDAGVIAAILDLKARGLSVLFYPFVMMDIAPGNALPNPLNGAASQPAYPWRGRITCDPAPGQDSSVDGTATAGAQVAAFFGSASPPADEWSFRRFVLHCASLCEQAGGVDAFIVGSEFAALTRVRSASGVYPAANALAALAQDCKALLGDATKISYAADWTEYGAHVLGGGAEVRFPLDVVWADDAVDFIGIDAYWPLSDWRDGAHLDQAVAGSIYDRDYLRARIAGGEAFDWYYADAGARASQTRLPIADGAYGKPWIFRQKDLVGWWSQAHVERVGGVELGTATGWVPQSKPIWLVETGCPAVDRGANAPNVFPDPKSSDGGCPYFSAGLRDDLMQARAIEAVLSHFDPAHEAYVAGANPVSAVYGDRMVDRRRIYLWAWDARPFPAFPSQASVWGDAANWETGHWLNGRLEGASLDRLLVELAREAAPQTLNAGAFDVDGWVDGYVLDRQMSARSAIDPLGALFGFDMTIRAGAIGCARRDARNVTDLGDDDLVLQKDGSIIQLVRAQESELPVELALTFWDGDADYRTATALSRRLEGGSQRRSQTDLAIVLQRAQAQRLCDIALEDSWVARETARFILRPGRLALEIGDAVRLPSSASKLYRIEKINDGGSREIAARAVEPSIQTRLAPRAVAFSTPAPAFPGPPFVRTLDLAIAASDAPALQYVAASADPWPGSLTVWRQNAEASYVFDRSIAQRAIIGETLDGFASGVVGRLDLANTLTVRLAFGALASISDEAMLGGANVAAISSGDGAWEIFSFAQAELIAARTWKLSRLLRGLGGEEALATRSLAAGAIFVLMDSSVVSLVSERSRIGGSFHYRIGPSGRDYADSSYVAVDATVTAKALTPYAPVHARARRTGDGVEISFMRRSRRDGDAWDLVDIPLAEEREAYEIEILDGGDVVRTLSVVEPSALYAAADEIVDFGAPQTALDLRIFQMSASVGRGFPLRALTPVA